MEQQRKGLPLLAEQLVADSSTTHNTRKGRFILNITDQVELTQYTRSGSSAQLDS